MAEERDDRIFETGRMEIERERRGGAADVNCGLIGGGRAVE
jgi:hypothetical protein